MLGPNRGCKLTYSSPFGIFSATLSDIPVLTDDRSVRRQPVVISDAVSVATLTVSSIGTAKITISEEAASKIDPGSTSISLAAVLVLLISRPAILTFAPWRLANRAKKRPIPPVPPTIRILVWSSLFADFSGWY